MTEIETRVLRNFGTYDVVLGSYDETNELEAPYKVQNVDTGVYEFQSYVLPAALEMAYKFAQALINLNKEFDTIDRADSDKVLSLVPKAH